MFSARAQHSFTQGHREKNKPSDNVVKEVEQEEYFCDRYTEAVDDLVQCKRCGMWLCSGCEKMSPEVI